MIDSSLLYHKYFQIILSLFFYMYIIIVNKESIVDGKEVIHMSEIVIITVPIDNDIICE